jgi:DNA-directed RNA polymerase II subunit RPB4
VIVFVYRGEDDPCVSKIKMCDLEDIHAISVSDARAVVTAMHKAWWKKNPKKNPFATASTTTR